MRLRLRLILSTKRKQSVCVLLSKRFRRSAMQQNLPMLPGDLSQWWSVCRLSEQSIRLHLSTRVNVIRTFQKIPHSLIHFYQ